METIKLAAKALEKVLFEHEKFHLALRSVFYEDENEKNKNNIISTLLGCQLRHHYFIEHAFKEIDDELTNEKKCLLYIALANNLFSKKVDNDEVVNYMMNLLPDHAPFLHKLLRFKKSPKELIPEYLPEDSNEALSLQYNTPEWLIRMWQKQFGYFTMKKLLKRNIRPSLLTCRVNPLVMTKEQLLEKSSHFRNTRVKDMVIYSAKTPLRRQSYFHNYEVFLLKLGFKEALDRADLDLTKEAFLYSEDDNSVVREFLIRYEEKQQVHLGIPLLEGRDDIEKIIKYNQLTDINFFVAKSNEVQNHLDKLVDLVIIHPNSSRLDLIRTYPDYLIHFDTQNFDTLIRNQRETLTNLAPFVKEGGMLLYIVTTINKKESRSIINQFLSQNPHFVLVEQKQLFPFDRFDSSLYYAILKHQKKESE